MTYQTILYELRDDIATISLNRPDVRNGLNSICRHELLDAFLKASKSARVIVLTGKGQGFCSGQDLSEFSDPTTIDLTGILNREYVPLLNAIYDCPIPTIAAVSGAAVGAGANLALACDVVIAAKSAVFMQVFANIGLIPDAGGTYWLPRQIGLPRALGAGLFAEPISATQAVEWGMIWEAVEDDAFAEHVQSRAIHLATGPTTAYQLMKSAMRASYDNTVSEQLALEATSQGIAGRTSDFVEGVTAFLQKRRPKYKGR